MSLVTVTSLGAYRTMFPLPYASMLVILLPVPIMPELANTFIKPVELYPLLTVATSFLPPPVWSVAISSGVSSFATLSTTAVRLKWRIFE